jgi:hypothetical protein
MTIDGLTLAASSTTAGGRNAHSVLLQSLRSAVMPGRCTGAVLRPCVKKSANFF